jgi:hypothetical protein
LPVPTGCRLEATPVTFVDNGRAHRQLPRSAIAELVRKHGISRNTDFNWKSRYSGAEVSELKQLRELEAENAKLNRQQEAAHRGGSGRHGRPRPQAGASIRAQDVTAVNRTVYETAALSV